MAGFSACDGLVRLPKTNAAEIQCPARVYLFRHPRSFTRQDVVELHIPGSVPVANALLGRLVHAGARQGQPGEFTARAFFSGRIDLSAAEAVADIIDAADKTQLRAAMTTLEGRIEQFCGEVARQITDVLAEVEASIDLAEEDISLSPPCRLAQCLDNLAEILRATALKAVSLPETAQRPTMTLAGRPNVGKSSLLNALSGTDRAIVSVLSGTTRDVLTATMALPSGGVICLQDAAGFAHSQTPLDVAAHQATRQAVGQADVIGFVVDGTDTASLQDDLTLLAEVRNTNEGAPLLLLVNKADMPVENPADRLKELANRTALKPLVVSAVTGQGLEGLKATLGELLHLGTWRSGEAMGLHERQKGCLLAAAKAVQQAGRMLHPAVQVADVAELAAIELREALAQLGQISGQVVTENLLGQIFARFCVGK